MEMTKHRTISISFTTKQEGGKEQTLTMTVSDEFIPVWDMDQPNPVALSMPRILEELRSQDREVPVVSKKETPLPPMGKQPKITTLEELIDGVDGNAIKRFAKEQQGASPTPPHAENSSAEVG